MFYLNFLKDENTNITIGAHRGVSKECPENTIPAFEKTLEIGVDHIECDVQLTKDNELVVFHDFLIDRTTNGTGLLTDHSLSELRSLDAGNWFSKKYSGTPIPTLEEVLVKFKNKIRLSLELKEIEPRQSSIARKIVDIVKSHDMEDQIQLMSFNHKILYDVRTLDKKSIFKRD